jgi:hypothetical protein
VEPRKIVHDKDCLHVGASNGAARDTGPGISEADQAKTFSGIPNRPTLEANAATHESAYFGDAICFG